ncbi:MAG: outer membrane lipid asymmetry maintenance protein MlaD [Rhodobacteraceae bacterium]|nr:outer membrane lipid asymmetry maintenance protein MlaD [Paracoccaceae bacterium]
MAENSPTEIMVGGAVLALAFGFLLYATNVTGAGGGGAGQYELTASFRSAEGVSVGTDVRLAGVKVGTVTALDLNPQTYRADARFSLDDAIALPDDSAALIASEGLLGGTFVEIVPGGSPFDLEPGGEVLDTQGAVSLVTLLLKFFTSSGEGDTQ